MTISLPARIRLAFAAVLLLGAALSVFVSWNGHLVQAVSRPLLEQQLPLLARISQLQLRVAEQEPILYEYYATTDRAVFQRRFGGNDAIIGRDLAALAEDRSYAGQAQRIRADYARLGTLAAALDDTLRVYGEEAVDWDHARELLVEVSSTGRSVNEQLAAIAAAVRAEVGRGGATTRNRVESVTGAVLAFSGLIVIIAAFVGYYVTAYLREAAERHKLAMFVEKNPNPVLRLSIDGEVLYANPGVSELLAATLGADRPLAHILPAGLRERQHRLVRESQLFDRFEYTLAGRILDCVLRYLPEHGVFHCYLADVTERKLAAAQLQHQALHDDVLGLPNRRYLEGSVRALEPAQNAALLLINVDRFRQLLSDVGPEVGDELLRAVAKRLANQYPAGASPPPLYRFEGDTLALLITGPGDARRQAADTAHRALDALQDPFYVEGHEIFLSVSIGAALYPLQGTDIADLVRKAEAALHAVKQAGGNSFLTYSDEMSERAALRLSLEAELRRVLDRDELSLHLQPQVELTGGRIIGGEALLRWTRPGAGMVPPAQFIPIAEETGLIVPIGAWVLRQACRSASAWQGNPRTRVGVAINISARQFQRPGLTDLVREVLRETGVDPALVELEITEGSAMHDVEHTVRTLRDLKDLGVALAIDDFGTGFSSLSYLSRFPIDRLKIDQSFVRGLGHDQSATAITAAVITLGHSLNLRVIAEGVETPEQLEIVRSLGCDEMQGYLFSKPLPLREFEACVRLGQRLEPGPVRQGPFFEQPGLSTLV